MMRILTALVLTALSGCAMVPKPLSGEHYSDLMPMDKPEPGTAIRWGGEIIATDAKAGETCFQVLSRKLSPSARPLRDDRSFGRFIACKSGFYDPVIYDKGREISLTGEIIGLMDIQVGEYDYQVSKVVANIVYLWPMRYSFDEYEVRPYPFWWPYYGGGIIHYHHMRPLKPRRPRADNRH